MLGRLVLQRQEFIVYMGDKKHHDPELRILTYKDMLAFLLGSKEAAQQLLVHSYEPGSSGFSASLTQSQAHRIAGMMIIFLENTPM